MADRRARGHAPRPRRREGDRERPPRNRQRRRVAGTADRARRFGRAPAGCGNHRCAPGGASPIRARVLAPCIRRHEDLEQRNPRRAGRVAV